MAVLRQALQRRIVPQLQRSAQRQVEHYEIAAYGSAKSFAKTLGQQQAASLLEQTLQEEKEADKKLTSIAESTVNSQALQSGHLQAR